MVDYQTKAPGVYFENITAAGPIAGVGTSVAALIGQVDTVADADAGVPVLVTNWTAYVDSFGGYDNPSPCRTPCSDLCLRQIRAGLSVVLGFPVGVVLLAGAAIVPPPGFIGRGGDEVM